MIDVFTFICPNKESAVIIWLKRYCSTTILNDNNFRIHSFKAPPQNLGPSPVLKFQKRVELKSLN